MRSVWMMYHDVYAREPQSGVPCTASAYHISQASFQEHLAAIRASGRRVLSVGEYLNQRPQNSVVLTFDDGWRGAFEHAIPLLRSFGWKATFFVTRDFVGRTHFCTQAMLRDAARADMEIGVHGTTHRMLSACTRPQIVSEFTACRSYLEAAVEGPVSSASLPGGDLTNTIVACATEAGLQSLCTSKPGINGQRTSDFSLKRIAIRSTTSAADVARYCSYDVRREVARWAVFQVPRLLLGMKTYSRLRRRVFGERAGQANEIFQP